ncbi:MAG: ubiquinone biosynthesis protein UbiJ [Porticoccaceae bacterium]
MMLSVLRKTALGGIEALIDTALAHDPASASALALLEGQVLFIESTLPPINIALEPNAGGVKLHDQWEGEASVTITGSLVAMAGVAINAKESVSFSGTGITVSGNLDTLNQLNKIMGNLDIDWEAALAEIVGDIPAHLLAKSIRNSAVFRADTVRRATTGMVEVAQEEFNLTPSTNEFETSAPEIRKLSSDVDRVAARLKRLQQKLQQHHQGPLNS